MGCLGGGEVLWSLSFEQKLESKETHTHTHNPYGLCSFQGYLEVLGGVGEDQCRQAENGSHL